MVPLTYMCLQAVRSVVVLRLRHKVLILCAPPLELMPPKVARLGHIAFETPDLESSTEFFTDVVGFEEVERTDESVYLRAVDEFYHHSFVLHAGEEAGVDHVAWQTWTAEDLAALAEELEEAGYDLTPVAAGEEVGQGEAYRFSTPSGHRFEIYYEMEKPQPPEEKRSKLNNRPYNPNTTVHIAPQQIDHVQLWNPDGKALADWFQNELEFMEQEHFDLSDGTRWGTFLTASRSKIDAAIIHGEDDDATDDEGDGAVTPADLGLDETALPPGFDGIDAVLVGADAVLADGRVVNKTGTRALSLAATRVGVPVYVVAARAKVRPDRAIHGEATDPASVYDGETALRIASPRFDVTPADCVTAVVTEDGPLDGDAIRRVAAEHRKRAAWVDAVD